MARQHVHVECENVTSCGCASCNEIVEVERRCWHCRRFSGSKHDRNILFTSVPSRLPYVHVALLPEISHSIINREGSIEDSDEPARAALASAICCRIRQRCQQVLNPYHPGHGCMHMLPRAAYRRRKGQQGCVVVSTADTHSGPPELQATRHNVPNIRIASDLDAFNFSICNRGSAWRWRGCFRHVRQRRRPGS